MRNELRRYIQKVATGRTNVEVLLYFLERPRGGLTSAEVAERIGRPVREVTDALSELSEKGVLGYLPDFGGRDLCYFNAALHMPEIVPCVSDFRAVAHELEQYLTKSPPVKPGGSCTVIGDSENDRRRS